MMHEQISHHDLYRILGNVEGKVDAVLNKLSEQHQKIGEMEGRINQLERSKHWIMGLAAGLGATAGSVASLFGG